MPNNEPPKPRAHQPSKADGLPREPKRPLPIVGAPILDQQPERAAVRMPRADPPKRAGTLPQMAALRAPPVIAAPEAPTHPAHGTLTGLPAPAAPGSAPPPPARVPVDLAPTLPAPNPLQRLTVRRPTPPSAVALARRSDPPQQAATPAAGTSVEPQLIGTEASSQRPPSASLPPASQAPGDATHQAQRREIERVTAERDQARAQVQLERLRVEEQERAEERTRLDAAAKLAELQLEIEREKTKQATAPEKRWLDERLVKALAALLGAMAALGTPLGIWLTTRTTTLEAQRQRDTATAKDATATASSAKAESSGTDKALEDLKKQLAAERAYNREVWRRMGVQVPKREGDPDPPKLVFESTPLRKPGAVTPGPSIIVKTPPP